jgi:signal transduction histidine kinase
VSRNIGEQVDRATSSSNHLREFGRKSDLEVYPVDLNDPIRDIFTIIGQQLRLRNIELSLRLDESLGKILADKNRLEQIFLNLVTNARDACIYDTDTSSKAWEVIARTKLETDADAGETILFEITDNGIGMIDEVKKKLFTRFFSTKAGRGTGLGLLVTQKIIREHGGEISVKSKAGEGTTFFVRLKREMPEDMEAHSAVVATLAKSAS